MLDRRRTLALIASVPATAALGPPAARAQIADLISRMTLEEKLGQLTILSADFTVTGPAVPNTVDADLRAGRVGSLFNLWGRDAVRKAQRTAVEDTRLGVPLFFALDILHGFRTILPIPLAEAGAFDPDLWAATAHLAADEAVAAGVDLTFAPMLDVARDPRWGRIAESPGEDPHVAARFADAKVRGLQGPDLAGLAACPKHFVGYGASAAGRDYAAVDLSDRALAEIYLPPFRAAIAAGAVAVMPAFTDIAGVPLTAHRGLLTGVLRDEWGFDGVVISDYTAIRELLNHGVAADLPEAAALALNAGVDIDMMSRAYLTGLPAALDRGLTSMATIDAAVGRVLGLKHRLGLFDDPYRRCAGPEPARPLARDAARDAACRSIVLLTNDGTLPLPSDPGRIAVIGPLADARGEMLGPWAGAGRGEEAVSVLAGLRAALPSTAITHVQGTPIDGAPDEAPGDPEGIAQALAAIDGADRVVLCLGEAAWMSGEAASRGRLDLPGRQQALADAVLATGKPTIMLLFSGRPLALPAIFDRAAAALACWFPGTEAGAAIAELLTGAVSPSAGLAASWPRDVGQVPLGYGDRPGGRPENPADKYTSKYLDLPNAPQFAFGHGLTYTSFALSDPTVTGAAAVETTVTNTGARPGTATVFLFIRDPVASVARPALELRRFAKLSLEPGESRPLTFRLNRADFAFPGVDLRPLVEPGPIEIHVGFSADPAALRSTRLTLE